MQLFYNISIDNNTSQVVFNKEESRHIVKVLRKREGDVIHLTNGKNTLFQAEIVEANDKKCIVKIVKISKEKNNRNYKINIAIAPTKNNNRFEWFLEKATEIGVDEIFPILCAHSERKIIKHERMQKVVVTAMKQSLQYQLPVLHELTTFEQAMSAEFKGQKIIAQCLYDNDSSKMNLLQKTIKPATDILVLIGPEGGFSDKEIQIALSNGFVPVSLGNNRLRTETAGIITVHTIQLINNR